jgi:hypothetical protein
LAGLLQALGASLADGYLALVGAETTADNDWRAATAETKSDFVESDLNARHEALEEEYAPSQGDWGQFIADKAELVAQWWSDDPNDPNDPGFQTQFIGWVSNVNDKYSEYVGYDADPAQAGGYTAAFQTLTDALGAAAATFTSAIADAGHALSTSVNDAIAGYFDGHTEIAGVKTPLAENADAMNAAEKEYRDTMNAARRDLDQGKITQTKYNEMLTAAANPSKHRQAHIEGSAVARLRRVGVRKGCERPWTMRDRHTLRTMSTMSGML